MRRIGGISLALALALAAAVSVSFEVDPHREALLTYVHQATEDARITPPPPPVGAPVDLDSSFTQPDTNAAEDTANPPGTDAKPSPNAATPTPAVAPESPVPDTKDKTETTPADTSPTNPGNDPSSETTSPDSEKKSEERPISDTNKDKGKKEKISNNVQKPQNGGAGNIGNGNNNNNQNNNNAGNLNPNNTSNNGSKGVLSMAAIIGIASAGGVLLLVLCGLLLFAMRKRAIKRSNSSYFHFPDADEAGNQALPSTASVDQLPTGAGMAAAAAIAKKRRSDSESDGGRADNFSPGGAPTHESAPSAPTHSVIRRASDLSSASSDTIVAPELGTVQSTGHLPPWLIQRDNV